MKKLKLSIGLIMLAALTFAQDPDPVDGDTLWKVSGVTSLSISQLSHSNWAAGGENSFSGNAFFKNIPGL